MALSNFVYPGGKAGILGLASDAGPIDFDADPLYLMLVTTNYSSLAPATALAHVFRSDVLAVSGAEASGTGYTAGGAALAGLAIAASGNNRVVNATNPTWPTSTISATGAILFKRVGADLTTPADDILIAYYDFSGTVASTAGTFTVNLSSGILLAS